MIGLLLNSGTGSRLGKLTCDRPKTMVEIAQGKTIIARQLELLKKQSVDKIVITTGPFEDMFKNYLSTNFKDIEFIFVHNALYRETNYIYSIYLAREYLKNDDILLIHGDLVFDSNVICAITSANQSTVAVSSQLPIDTKDFKGMLEGNRVSKIGVDIFEHAIALQPLYKLLQKDWRIWMNEIVRFCEGGRLKCYAEDAFNEISSKLNLCYYDFKDKICFEIDNETDLLKVQEVLRGSAK